MNHLLLVMLGGGIGAGLRHLVSLGTLRAFGPGFPVGTLSVNIIGSLVMGLFIGWLVRHEGAGMQSLLYFVATGILGGFTTFSAFSLDTAVLWERGDTMLAMIYIAASVILSLVAVFAGLFLMRSLGSA
ncbi:fluoride efflux transporter CrcB [Roseibium sediminis]|uniref:fluoride efflux transporter CrcB n=1 Tax=Roseibium sediminis TaxID=1775174 RepID=UPI00123DFC4F|nr:fluoride efflux transporter CrcB [Roseibium sediminis]